MTAPLVEPEAVEDDAVEVLVGRPPVRLDRRSDAPLGWWPAIVMLLVSFVDRVETQLIAGALPQIQAEFGFSDTWGGAIPTSAALAGVLLVLPAGYLADRANRTRLLTIVVASWSVITLGSALAPTFAILFATRVLLGTADQIDTPASSSLLGDYYPVRARSRAYAIQRVGYFLGLPTGVLLGGVFAEHWGWRSAFLFIIVPGTLVAFLCYRLPEPVRGALERAYGDDTAVVEADENPIGRTGLRELVGTFGSVWAIPTVRGLCLGVPILFLALGGLFYWLPSFFERTHALGESAAAGITAGAGGMGVLVGMGFGAWLGDRNPRQRLTIGAVAMLLGTGAFALALVMESLLAHTIVFNLVTILVAVPIPNLTAAFADVVPNDRRGASFALLQFTTGIGGAFGPLLIGIASDVTGSLRLGLSSLVVPLVIGSVMVLRTGRRAAAEPVRSDKIVVVTGSSRGIGLGLARELADRGARLVVCGRDAATVDTAVADIAARTSPDQVTGTACDVTDPASVQALWDHAVDRFGRVDIWINNAGSTASPVQLADVPAAQLDRVVATNVLGALYGCRVAAAGMRTQRGKGMIYNVEGLGSKGEVQQGMVAYGATKAAVGYLLDALRKDLKAEGVRVGAIRPGINVTEHLLYDAHLLTPERWAQTRKVMNILGDLPETTTPWLADRILTTDRDGARIAWLSTTRASWRFMAAPFNRGRDVFAEAGVRDPHEDDR